MHKEEVAGPRWFLEVAQEANTTTINKGIFFIRILIIATNVNH